MVAETKAKEVINLFTKGFYTDLAERTIATFAQALGAFLLGGFTGVLDVDWVAALSVAALAALLAVLKAFAAAGLGDAETGASFGTTVPKGTVAAIEEAGYEGSYVAEEASPYEEGTPVDVVPDSDKSITLDQHNR